MNHSAATEAKADTAAYNILLKQISRSRDSIFQVYNKADDQTQCVKNTEAYLIETYYKKLIPFWLGTKWEFYGETQIPGDSSIACGHFVVTTLKQLGCKLENSHEMATNYSAYMVNSLCDTSYKVYKGEELLQLIKSQPDDIWVVGLKNHSALIVKYQGQIRFVHSSYFAPTMVVDEPIEESMTFWGSNIYVSGHLFKDNCLTEKWIKDEVVKYTKKY
ncbi:MAG: hypothetical protein ACTHJT_08495 [Cytophaga sp.]